MVGEQERQTRQGKLERFSDFLGILPPKVIIGFSVATLYGLAKKASGLYCRARKREHVDEEQAFYDNL